MPIISSIILRRILLVDAVASAGAGLLLSLGSARLSSILELPQPLLFWAGLSLLPFAALVYAASRRAEMSRRAILAIAVYNLLWALDSLAILVLGWVEPNAVGAAFLAIQAMGVAMIAGLQYLGLQRAAAPA